MNYLMKQDEIRGYYLKKLGDVKGIFKNPCYVCEEAAKCGGKEFYNVCKDFLALQNRIDSAKINLMIREIEYANWAIDSFKLVSVTVTDYDILFDFDNGTTLSIVKGVIS